MRKKPEMTVPLEVNLMTREVRVERRFLSERSTKDMLKSLIRAHAEPA